MERCSECGERLKIANDRYKRCPSCESEFFAFSNKPQKVKRVKPSIPVPVDEEPVEVGSEEEIELASEE